MPSLSLQSIAASLDATLIGDGNLVVTRVVHPADAKVSQDMALAFEKELHPLLEDSKAGAVALAEGQEDMAKNFKGAVVVKRGRLAMAKLTALFANPANVAVGVHPSAVVDVTAKIGKNVSIGPFCYVGADAVVGDGTKLVSQVTVSAGARLGKDCLLYAGVRVGDNVVLGDRVIVHYNSVIGSDGFSFVTPEPGSAETAKRSGGSTVESFNTEIIRIHSLGAVVLGDDVEIGACTAIDRGTVTDTRIGRGTKIDNQVQIAHNVIIGENCLICGNVGVAGSSTIGDRVVLAARSGIADHLKIGDDAVLMAAAQLGSNVPSKAIYMGLPAMPRERFFEQMIHLARIKNMAKRIAALEEKINTLEKDVKKS